MSVMCITAAFDNVPANQLFCWNESNKKKKRGKNLVQSNKYETILKDPDVLHGSLHTRRKAHSIFLKLLLDRREKFA